MMELIGWALGAIILVVVTFNIGLAILGTIVSTISKSWRN